MPHNLGNLTVKTMGAYRLTGTPAQNEKTPWMEDSLVVKDQLWRLDVDRQQRLVRQGQDTRMDG
jgi:hypothetical protein